MKKVPHLCTLIYTAVIVFSSGLTATATTAAARLEQYARKLIAEETLLAPVNAFGDATQYVAEISDDLLCGISQGRLKIFSKDNVENVLSSYWVPCRLPRTFEYYKGYVYLPDGPNGFWIFDVRDPWQIKLVKKLDIATTDYATIQVTEDKLFLTDFRAAALVVFSLTNPHDPQEISRCSLPRSIHGNATSSIRVIGDLIYVQCAKGLAIVDGQDLQSLRLLGTIDIKLQTSLGGFVIKGSYAYVHAADEIRVFDISDPNAIEQKTATRADWCPYAVLRGNHIMGFGNNGVQIFNINEPLRPRRAMVHYNPIAGTLLIGKAQNYVITSNGQASPVTGLANFPEHPTRFGFRAENIVIRDNFAYVFGSGVMRVLDISKPWAPKEINRVKATSGNRETVLIKGSYLYTQREILDISEPTKPARIKSLKYGTGLTIKDNHLFIATGNNLDIWDVNNPSEAAMIKSVPFEEQLNKVFIHKSILYLGFYRGKLRACKLEDDLTLTTLDEIELAKSAHGHIMDFCEEDDFLYLALYFDGIAAVDIQNPQNLKIHGRFNTSLCAEQVKVLDAFAYVAGGGTVIIDMADKGYEKKIASYPSTGSTNAIAVSGNYVYSCEYENGIAVFVSNLSKLK